MEFRYVLSHYLEQRGMTPAELANAIGSPRSTINALLKGNAKEPKLSTAKAISDALGISLEEMARMTFGDENERHVEP
nr:helix-turn-helix transcriptional regulator [uncultured Olsenella sp.]